MDDDVYACTGYADTDVPAMEWSKDGEEKRDVKSRGDDTHMNDNDDWKGRKKEQRGVAPLCCFVQP